MTQTLKKNDDINEPSCDLTRIHVNNNTTLMQMLKLKHYMLKLIYIFDVYTPSCASSAHLAELFMREIIWSLTH